VSDFSSSIEKTTGRILAGDCLRGLLFLREGGIQTSGTMNPSMKRKKDRELGLRIRRVGRRIWCWIRRCRRRRRWRPASCDGTRGLGCPRRPSRRGGRTPRPTRPADWGTARGEPVKSGELGFARVSPSRARRSAVAQDLLKKINGPAPRAVAQAAMGLGPPLLCISGAGVQGFLDLCEKVFFLIQ
jgi:hypothetical protein